MIVVDTLGLCFPQYCVLDKIIRKEAVVSRVGQLVLDSKRG